MPPVDAATYSRLFAPEFNGELNDSKLFLPAHSLASTDSSNLATTRIAQRDWALARTATGAETYNVVFTLTEHIRTFANKGFRLDSLDVCYQVTTAALTTHTYVLSTRTFANNTANVLANITTTGTLATATQTLPYVTTITVTSPTFQNTALVETLFEIQSVMANTGVYRLYGIQLNFTRALV